MENKRKQVYCQFCESSEALAEVVHPGPVFRVFCPLDGVYTTLSADFVPKNPRKATLILGGYNPFESLVLRK